MILSGKAIQALLDQKKLKVEPEAIIKEASIKIHIADTIVLKPKEFSLGISKEKIVMPNNLAGFYDGYTHLARKGVTTHMGSMFVDPASNGPITLEIFNASSVEITLEAGSRVGHLIFVQVKS